MIREQADVTIVGAGFAGSLLALILRRLGRSAILLERGSHPRFAIGESSTPLANLVLDSLAREYDLPRVAPLAKYGSWQRTYPHLACGLKRGFTFFQHRAGRPYVPRADRQTELLVAASPQDEVGDTHWFREHVDHFFLKEAQALGASYFDRTEVREIKRLSTGWSLHLVHRNEPMEVKSTFLVDASGPACPVARALGVPLDPEPLLTNSWSVYSHFVDVRRFEDIYGEAGGDSRAHPYACDDAALHHVFDDGWMWVLRFNNGVTSAGCAWNGCLRTPTENGPAENAWTACLRDYPSLAMQFARSRSIQPFVRTGRLQRLAGQATGAGWALLPHAAYFLDPLYSGGNAHTLLGIERLGRIFRDHWGRPSFEPALARYECSLFREVQFLDRLIHGCYLAFGRFDLFVPYTMYYFAGAIHSEERRRRGEATESDEFLFSHDETFRTAVWRAYTQLADLVHESSRSEVTDFARQVALDISGFNTVGLCDPGKCNLYPYA